MHAAMYESAMRLGTDVIAYSCFYRGVPPTESIELPSHIFEADAVKYQKVGLL